MANELTLFDYQEPIVSDLQAGFAAGHRVQMLALATGGGKTEVAAYLMNLAANKGNCSAMVMDRRKLVDQTSMRLDKYDIDHGVMMAGHWRYHTYKSIQICSTQTLEAKQSLPNTKLMIVDEAHSSRLFINEFIKANTDVKVIGLSATPFTKGLANVYTNVVNGPTYAQLIASKRLVPLRVFVAKQIDMTGAKKVAGEWSQAEATERGIKITGDIVSEWIKKTHEVFGEPKKTIVFCAGVAHGEQLVKEFAAAGYNFVNISYKDDDDAKDAAFEEFKKPDSSIHGLIATDILTKGFDQGDVLIGVSARPFTKSFSSHVQQLGRVMRTGEGKEFALWLDHSGNYLRFLDDWEDLYHNGVKELDDGKEKPKPEPTEKEKEAALCSNCGNPWGPTDACQHCGHIRPRRNSVIQLPGELQEIRIGNSKVKAADNAKQLYAMCCTYAREHSAPDKQRGRAAHIYKDITGEWPPREFIFDRTPSEPISQPVYGRIQRKNIAFAKGRRA
ncbi:MAG: hypothetical protein RL563_1078 [Pseudomonadota bacterium]